MRVANCILALWLLVSGCSTFIPKKVELFQDKVQPFPEQSPALIELERQAVYRAHDRIGEAIVAATVEGSSTNVVIPAKEAEKLTEAVATVIGPPKKPASDFTSSEVLAVRLETAVAKLNNQIRDFRIENNENAGKKIEGTGLIQVPYILWTGGTILFLMVLFFIGRLVLSVLAVANPTASVGLNMVNAAQAVVAKGFSQLVKGGEEFKKRIEKEIDDPALKQKILDAFRVEHQHAQDSDVQRTIETITK